MVLKSVMLIIPKLSLCVGPESHCRYTKSVGSTVCLKEGLQPTPLGAG